VTYAQRRLRILLLVTVAGTSLATGLALAADGSTVDLRTTQPIQGDAAAGAGKAAVCAACHGVDGLSVVPQFPSLAGQSATYTYVQLRAFRDGWRDNAVMAGQVATLSDHDMRDLAAHYAAMAPKAAQSADATSRGGQLYHDGDGALGIPACQGCHGPDGHGPRPDPSSTAPQPAWSTFPALAGQPPDYVLAQLKAYHDGSRAGSSNTEVMHGAVANLGEQDMQALATYISTM
jgi:cytochrome c553